MEILVIAPKLNRVIDASIAKLSQYKKNKYKFLIYDEKKILNLSRKLLIRFLNNLILIKSKEYLYKKKLFEKLINRLYSYLYRPINTYTLSQYQKLNKKFDFILFIKTAGMDKKYFELFKAKKKYYTYLIPFLITH